MLINNNKGAMIWTPTIKVMAIPNTVEQTRKAVVIFTPQWAGQENQLCYLPWIWAYTRYPFIIHPTADNSWSRVKVLQLMTSSSPALKEVDSLVD